jgi:hypothetical protein
MAWGSVKNKAQDNFIFYTTIAMRRYIGNGGQQDYLFIAAKQFHYFGTIYFKKRPGNERALPLVPGKRSIMLLFPQV